MSRPLYRGMSGIGIKLTVAYYDPKEPSENGIGGCGRAAWRRRLAATAVKIGVLMLMVAVLVAPSRGQGCSTGAMGRHHARLWPPRATGTAAYRSS
jgi:hypothetical protein